MIDGPTNVESKPTAQANKADVLTSIHEGVLESGGEESAIPSQAKDKAHCFCPLLAAEHGEETAVIFQGLGYKIAKSKKVRKERKWHYDTLVALEKRWPYLSDSGIGGILDRKALEGFVLKDRFNKWQKDRTNWYSMPDDLVARAMSDVGKLWFDVPAAIKCRSITAGALYQNLRYQLLLFLADNPAFDEVPYHRVNKAALARVLPWSLSTIKREYVQLLEVGLIAKNPACGREYTICNPTDLIVPDAMKKHALKNRSSADKGGSSVEMSTVSFAEMTGSSTEKNVSSTGKIGSSAVSNTHYYKPFEKHIHKHHSPTAALGVGGVCSNAASAAHEDHQDIGNEHGSAPVPGKENEDQSWDLDTIANRISTLLPLISDSEHAVISKEAPGLAQWFVAEELSYSAFKGARQCSTVDQISPLVEPALHCLFSEHGTQCGWSTDGIELAFLWALEVVTGVLSIQDSEKLVVDKKLSHWLNVINEIYSNMPEFLSRANASAQAKAEMFIDEIRRCNKEGWPTYKNGDVKFTVNASDGIKTAAEGFFHANIEIPAENVWRVLADCVEVQVLKHKPKDFDPLWKTRQGVRPAFLFKYWEEINAEIDAAWPIST